MNDIISVLGLNGVPKLFMLSIEDIHRYEGHKAVIAMMAVDRTHPEFKKAEQYFASLQDEDELVVIAEDHADGPLHERFQCKPQEFCYALIGKDGSEIMRGDQLPTLEVIRQHLHAGHA